MPYLNATFPPEPIPESALVGVGTSWPIGLTLEELSEWYYRARLWQMTVHFSGVSLECGFTSSEGDPADYDTHVALDADLTCSESAYISATSESDYHYLQSLTVPNTSADQIETDFAPLGPSTAASVHADASFSMFSNAGFPWCKTFGGLWYPRIEIDFVISMSVQVGVGYQNKRYQATGGGEGSLVEGTIFGKPMALGFELIDETETGWFPGTFHSISPYSQAGTSFSIEPTQWWPYDPGDGAPCRDILTGARLRDVDKIIVRKGEVVILP
jgi:hypothetical protein